MKTRNTISKIRASLILLFLICVSGVFSQPTLTFRVLNPRIIRVSGNDRLEFQIDVKASATGTYYAGLQATINTTYSAPVSAFVLGSTISLTKIGLSLDPVKYPTLIGNVNASGRIGISLSTDYHYTPGDDIADYLEPMPDVWTPLCIAQVRINTTYVDQVVAGMVWNTGLMNVNEFYQNPAANQQLLYTMNSSSYEPDRFQNLYLGRIYSDAFGWSQFGNSVNAQWVNWSVARNTSVFDGVGTLSTANALSIGLRIHPGGQLKILPGGQLTCSGPTELNGAQSLWINSDATGTGSFIDNGTVAFLNSGSAKVERYFANQNTYHFFSMPVTNTTLTFGDIFNSDWLQIWVREFYEGDNTWFNKWHYDLVIPGKGYSSYITTASNPTAQFVGNIGFGTITYPSSGFLTYHSASGHGWNLAGNPYPSAINWSSVTRTNVDAAVYVWSATGGNYLSNIPGDPPIGSLPDGTIPMAQGFFVKATSASASLTFTNAARLHSGQSFYKSRNVTPELLSIKITNSINEKNDMVVVNFNPIATSGFDSEFDAYKLPGDADAPEIYTTGNPFLSINTLRSISETPVIPIGFKAGVSGNFTFTTTGMESFTNNEPIWLEDITADQRINLRTNPTYTFASDTGSFNERFKLWFTPVGIEETKLQSFTVYATGNTVHVNIPKGLTGTVSVYNVVGQLMACEPADDSGSMVIQFNGNAGVYLVQFISESMSATRKVFIR